MAKNAELKTKLLEQVEGIKKRSVEKKIIFKNLSTFLTKEHGIKGFSEGSISNLMKEASYENKALKSLRDLERKLITLSKYLELIPIGWEPTNGEFYKKINEKTKLFFNSNWLVYYYKDSGTYKKKGIARTIFKIGDNPNSLVFQTTNTKYDKGTFEVLEDKNFLHITLQTEYFQRCLHITGYIGSRGIPDLFIGAFTNVTGDLNLVAGFMVLVHCKNIDEFEPQHFSLEDERFGEISEEIRMFFDVDCKRHLKIPSSPLSMRGLKEYLKNTTT